MIIERLLRKTGQRLYVTEDGGLTDNPAEALRFDGFGAAMHLCRQYDLKQMEFVLRFGANDEIVTELGEIY